MRLVRSRCGRGQPWRVLAARASVVVEAVTTDAEIRRATATSAVRHEGFPAGDRTGATAIDATLRPSLAAKADRDVRARTQGAIGLDTRSQTTRTAINDQRGIRHGDQLDACRSARVHCDLVDASRHSEHVGRAGLREIDVHCLDDLARVDTCTRHRGEHESASCDRADNSYAPAYTHACAPRVPPQNVAETAALSRRADRAP